MGWMTVKHPFLSLVVGIVMLPISLPLVGISYAIEYFRKGKHDRDD